MLAMRLMSLCDKKFTECTQQVYNPLSSGHDSDNDVSSLRKSYSPHCGFGSVNKLALISEPSRNTREAQHDLHRGEFCVKSST